MVIILKKKFFSQINLKGFIAITCKPLIEKNLKNDRAPVKWNDVFAKKFFYGIFFSGCFSNSGAYIHLADLPCIYFEEQLF